MKILIVILESFITILIGWSIKVTYSSNLQFEGKMFMSVCLIAITILFIMFSEIIRHNLD